MRHAFLLLLLPLLASAPPAPSDVDDLVAAQLVAAAGAGGDAGVDARARFRHVRGPCGRGVGACVLGHCCSARGTCGLSPWACGPLCQPEFSGPGSPCRGGGVPKPPPPLSLPVAAGPGAPCGAYVAACPDHTCCTRLGACALLGSGLCSSGGGKNATSLTRRHRLVAYHARVAPDGVERVAAVVNGRTPGPVISVDAGDTAVVEFVSALPDPSSLHWHGVRVGADTHGLGVASDGAAGVTQRPVAAAVDGAATAAAGPPVFLYNVAPTDPGTYWWHAHAGVQYVDGLRGALVVRGEGDRHRPADAVVFIADWYRAPAAAFLPKLMGPGNPLGNEPVPSSVTINGVASDGGFSCVNGTAAAPCPPPPPVVRSAPAACSSTSPLPLLRFVNGGAMAPVAVHVVRPGGPRLHTFVVAADGVPTARTRVAGPLRLAVGQRLDVEVCSVGGGGGDESTFSAPAWLVAVMDSSRFDATPSAPASLAVLDFDGSGAPPAAPPAYDADAKGYLPPLPPPGGAALAPPPRSADVTHTFTIESKVDGADASAYYVNGVSHRPDLVDGPAASIPSLLERLTANPENMPPPRDPPPPAAAAAPGAAPPRDARAGWHVVRVPRGSVVDLVFNNRDAGNDHPMHVHGLPFWVLNAGEEGDGDFVIPAADESGDAPPTPLVARDTATVAPASHLRVRLVAAAPGPWYVHCHVAWHEATGLAVVLVVE